MKSSSVCAVVVVSLLSLSLSASAREMVLPAGTLLQCTLNEPNFSSATAAVGDPVLCHLRSMMQFGQQAFPRGSYLVGHLESAQDPGHFWGKGYMKIQFDRIGLPAGDMPLDAKVIATRGYKVDKYGDIDGKGHAKRDIVEWMIPPLWPWKIIMLPARGPRPTLKGESVLTLRLMDDVQLPQVSASFGPDWRFFGGPKPQNESYRGSLNNGTLNNGSLNNGSLNNGSPYKGSPNNGRLNNAALNNDTGPRLTVREAMPSEPRLEQVVRTDAQTGVQTDVQSDVQSDVQTDVQRNVQQAPRVTYARYTPTNMTASVTTIDSRFAGTAPGVPVFVLKTGIFLAVGNYTYQEGRISYELASGGSGVISTDEVDWTTTNQVNLQRGVRVTLRGGHPGSAAAGF